MNLVVLFDERAPHPARTALQRAAERVDARVVSYVSGGAVGAMRAAAERGDAVAFVAADAVLRADALASLRRHLDRGALLVGGRAIVGPEQRLGFMLARPRWGPDPVEPVAINAPAGQALAEFVRGPIDVPHRAAFVVAPPLALQLPADTPEAVAFLALGLRAFGRGATVCEPNLCFEAGDDPDDVVRLTPRVLRSAAIDAPAAAFHRDPPAVRVRLIGREIRVAGDVRGYERRPMPPTDALVTGSAGATSAAVSRLRRSGALREVHVCETGDGAALRALLSRTGDRYLLVCSGDRTVPDAEAIAALSEALESSGRAALALDGDPETFATALFHRLRIVDAGAFAGATVRDVIRAAVDALPLRRRYAVGPDREPLGPPAPARLPRLRRIDAIMLAASRPVLARQSLEALRENAIDGTTTVISPAGFAGVQTIVSAHLDVRSEVDAADPQLTGTLNAAIAASDADAVLLVRDDVNVPPGLAARLRAAFERMPELGIAVPRVGVPDRPESAVDVAYRDLQSMRTYAARLPAFHARAATPLDAATVPVMLVARRAFAVVGGFDPAFGFSRYGIEEFSRRVRSANFVVACVEDAFAHVHLPAESESLLAELDAAPPLRERLEARERIRDGFDPARDRVEGAARLAAPAVAAVGMRVLAALGDERELRAALPAIERFAQTFTSDDPLELVLVLDGTLRVPAAVAAVREILARAPVPLERTLNVRIETESDPGRFADPLLRTLRLAGCERGSLAALEPIAADDAALLLSGAPA